MGGLIAAKLGLVMKRLIVRLSMRLPASLVPTGG